jgi:hypothetical protein
VISFKAASLSRIHGAAALQQLLVARWVADIRANQAVRVLQGARPVASFVRLGTAVHRLAAHAATLPSTSQVRWRGPMSLCVGVKNSVSCGLFRVYTVLRGALCPVDVQYKGLRQSDTVLMLTWLQARTQLARDKSVAARRMFHRSARYLLHTLTLEALGLGAWVAGSTAGLLGVPGGQSCNLYEQDRAASSTDAIVESAEMVRKEVGEALAALFVDPATAVRQGHGLQGAAWAAARAVPGAIRRPLGAAAAAVQKTCIGMQQAVEYTLPSD